MRYKQLNEEEKKEFYEKYYVEIQRSDRVGNIVYVDKLPIIWSLSMKMATVGDVVYIGNAPIGIVFDVGKETIKIVHLSQKCNLGWYMKDSFIGIDINTCDNDGNRNMKIIRETCVGFDNASLYPAFAYIRSLGKEWYMPAKDELNLIYKNKDIINKALKTLRSKASGSVDLLENDWYWSSSSSLGFSAWLQRFSDGHKDTTNRDHRLSVRAVRALTI